VLLAKVGSMLALSRLNHKVPEEIAAREIQGVENILMKRLC